MKMRLNNALRSTVGAMGIAVALSTPVHAQESGDPAPIEEIVVTGSRIARPDYAATSPTISVAGDSLTKTAGATLDSVLNQLPQFTPSRGATSGGSAQGGAGLGQTTANIRGLGPRRTLVLLDGRRVTPSNPDGTVDLNNIPDALIGNIEAITGGASAVYGSDAVSGVLNFRLRQNLEGLQIDAKTGVTEKGDGANRDITASWGGKFADGRGKAMLSFGYHDRDAVRAISRRFFSQVNGNFIPPSAMIPGDAANPFSSAALAAQFARYGTPFVGGAVPTQIGTVSSLFLGTNGSDGTLYSLFNLGVFGNPAGFANYKGSLAPEDAFDRGSLLNTNYSSGRFLVPDLRRYNAFGSLDYELTDAITAYAQFNYAENTARSPLETVFTGQTFGIYVPMSNPFIPADLRALLNTRPNPNAAFNIYKGFTDDSIGARNAEARYVTSQFLAGLRGELPGTSLTWDVYGSRGRVETTESLDGASLTAIQRLLAEPGLCSGYNVFSNAPQPQDCIDFIRRTARNRTETRQDLVEANLQGKLLELPAGEMRFAMGAGYRKTSYSYDPDSLFLVTVTDGPAGVRDPATSDFLGNLGSPPAAGSTDVYELYGELLVPLLRDLPFVQELNLNVAGRYSRYDTVGSVWTYKAEGDWRVGGGFRVRGGYNRAVRAPSVGELYKAAAGGFTQIGDPRNGEGDPCSLGGSYRNGPNAAQVRALCLAAGVPASTVDSYNYNYPVAVSRNLSNAGLKEEKADTLSLGAVWTSPISSPWLSGLQISVDYYSIKISNAIGEVPGNISLAKCFNRDGSNPDYAVDNFYCQLISRDAGSGVPIEIAIPTLNLATFKTTGLDFQVDWRIGLADIGFGENAGTVRLNAVVNYLRSFDIKADALAQTRDYAGTIGDRQIDAFGISKPKWKSTVTAGYANGAFDAQLRWRFIDAMRDSGRVTGAATPGVKSVNYFDLNAGITINKDYRLTFGVDNLFDKALPQWTGFGATDQQTYDVLGRKFYAAIRANF